MGFWIIIGALALAVGAILAHALLRGRAGTVPAAAYDLQVYRDQLKEVDRDLARGVIAAEDAERVRTEISRRILAADAVLQRPASRGASGGGNLPVAIALVVLMLAGSLALYARLGAPGYGDLPLEARIAASDQARADRLDQAEAEARAPARPPAPEPSADYLALMDKLRETVRERPEDPRGLRLLVRNEAALGNVTAAYEAQAKLIDMAGPGATADDHALMADLMIAAAGGYVSTEAEAALREALRRDPSHPTSRYYLGSYLMQVDRPDAAFRMWEQLLRESRRTPPGSPRSAAGSKRSRGAPVSSTELPPPSPGPTEKDIEAAGGMSAGDRDAMIRGMVQNLSDRLAGDGGSPEEWARLITAYGVLGETGRARAIWADAQQVFAGKPEALAQIRQGAEQAGVVE